MAIEIKLTDRGFKDSPDTGWPECTCSRCNKMIRERECPLRCVSDDKKTEWRFCESCMKGMGIIFTSPYDDEGNLKGDDFGWMHEPPY